MTTKIIVSGGFDPVHVGHLRMFKEASKIGDVIVLLNDDEWLKRKKGYSFMSFEDRKEIIEGFSCISEVWNFENDSLGSANNGLIKVAQKYPHEKLIFANGGDRTKENIPEIPICEKYNIEMLWNIGGGKERSSSDLVKNARLIPKD